MALSSFRQTAVCAADQSKNIAFFRTRTAPLGPCKKALTPPRVLIKDHRDFSRGGEWTKTRKFKPNILKPLRNLLASIVHSMVRTVATLPSACKRNVPWTPMAAIRGALTQDR